MGELSAHRCCRRRHLEIQADIQARKKLYLSFAYDFIKKTAHQGRDIFGIPSVPLPFPFRYAGKVDGEKHACARISATSACHPFRSLPFPFCFPSVMRVSLNVDQNMETCRCLNYVPPK